ncbi:cytochrome P450 71B25 [Xylariaceae sp. FL1651]|nr:cytochrome P450 71B25 [Xylariaceae sp. FL1651]
MSCVCCNVNMFTMELQYSPQLLRASTIVATLGVVVVLSLVLKLVKHRCKTARFQRQGLPMHPHSFLFGHSNLVARIVRMWPQKFYAHYLTLEVKRRFPMLPPIFYLGLWPADPPQPVGRTVTGASLIAQHEPQLLKRKGVLSFLQPLIGKYNLVTMEGDDLQYWRGIFNPNFSVAYLVTQVPGIVENTMLLCEILEERAGGKVFSLFETMSQLTMDMSCLAMLGSRLSTQRENCDLVAAFRSQARWIPLSNEQSIFTKLNSFRYIVLHYNRWRMDRQLSRELDSHFAMHIQGQGGQPGHVKRSDAIIDLVIKTYLSDKRTSISEKRKGKPTSPQLRSHTDEMIPAVMDARFKKFTISYMKLFLFAGYDTTASTAVYAIHFLSSHPHCLQRARDEHDAVLGTVLARATTAARISYLPQILNRLVYTSAVIKETLRLYPSVSSTRQSATDFALLGETRGQAFETGDFVQCGVHQAIPREPEHWPSPDSFIPERWLVGAGHALSPPNKEVWRPFGQGSRNCIGQELAVLEVTVILAMVLRSFDFKDAYAEYNMQTGRTGPTEVLRDRAYLISLGSSRPDKGCPCKVTKRAG